MSTKEYSPECHRDQFLLVVVEKHVKGSVEPTDHEGAACNHGYVPHRSKEAGLMQASDRVTFLEAV